MLDIKQEDNQDEVIYQILGRGPLIWRTVDEIAEAAGCSNARINCVCDGWSHGV